MSHDRADSAESEAILQLGREIRRRRRELSLSQQQLADLAGVSARFVHDLERGKATVRLLQVFRTLEALGLRVSVRPGKGLLSIEGHV